MSTERKDNLSVPWLYVAKFVAKGLVMRPIASCRTLLRGFVLLRGMKRQDSGDFEAALVLYARFVAYGESVHRLQDFVYERMAECYAELGDAEKARSTRVHAEKVKRALRQQGKW